MASLKSHIYFLVLCACLLIQTSSQSHNWSPNNHVALFLFGDSLFDAGNNNYIKNPVGIANFWPFGETFFKYPTGRFSDGRIIPDFIAEYLKLPLIPPYLQPGNYYYKNGVNFASGGAGALVETNQGMVIDLKTQVSYFKKVEKQLRQKLGDTETKALLSRAIYLLNVGNNDYVVPFTRNTTALQQYSRKEYVDMVIGNITIVLKEIYKNGGRKFGILNLPPLGCLPLTRGFKQSMSSGGGCMKEITVLAKLHNKALSKALKELKRQLKGFKYSKFDFYTLASEAINNPSKYGFKEGEIACCGSGPYRGIISCGGQRGIKEYELCENPSEYVFFDGVHPTDKANNLIAKLMWSGSSDVTGPCNLKQLFGA